MTLKTIIKNMSLAQIIFGAMLLIIASMMLTAYICALVIPDWQFLQENPLVSHIIAYSMLFVICFFLLIVLYIVIYLAIEKRTLQEKNEDLAEKNELLLEKIKGFEQELMRLKREE